jgi:hypothetical protein
MTTLYFKDVHNVMIALSKAESFSDNGTPSTKDLSILIVVIGIFLKYDNDESPVPKSSSATDNPISLKRPTAVIALSMSWMTLVSVISSSMKRLSIELVFEGLILFERPGGGTPPTFISSCYIDGFSM